MSERFKSALLFERLKGDGSFIFSSLLDVGAGETMVFAPSI
jgi:hypothetical protein